MIFRVNNRKENTPLFCRAKKEDFQSREKKLSRWGNDIFTIEHWKLNESRKKNVFAFPFSVKKFQNRRALHSLKASILNKAGKKVLSEEQDEFCSLYVFYLRANKNKIDMKVKRELLKAAVSAFAELQKHDTMPSGANISHTHIPLIK